MTKVFRLQHWHFLSLVILLAGIQLWINADSSFLRGELAGIKTYYWFLIAMLSPIIHQLYVLLCWRFELFHKSISKKFGAKGFKIYKIGFAILFIARLFTIVILAISNSNTLELNKTIAYLLAAIIFIPSAYLFYSVKNYFGFDRAFGIDHFDPAAFKNTPFVKKGIFRYSSNAMYVFGFLILWIPALIFISKAALLVALFNHVYIWVHYYFTELPDMEIIYKN